MSGEREKKQNLLKTEIIQSGYRPQDFVDFVNKIKEEGSDVDNWTYEELEELIRQFRSENKPQPLEEGLMTGKVGLSRAGDVREPELPRPGDRRGGRG